MKKLVKNISAVALAAAVAALPGAAYAGTSTATGTATLTVINQCSVTGATVNLGTFLSSQTWGNVASALGGFTGTVFAAGSQGQEYASWGSITCDNAAPYNLRIRGTGTAGGIKITLNGKTAIFSPFVKKLGGVVVADNNASIVGGGAQADTTGLSGTGTGAAQALLGSAVLTYAGTGGTVLATDALGAAGTASDTLTYTLNF